jgi:hypothetical protein
MLCDAAKRAGYGPDATGRDRGGQLFLEQTNQNQILAVRWTVEIPRRAMLASVQCAVSWTVSLSHRLANLKVCKRTDFSPSLGFQHRSSTPRQCLTPGAAKAPDPIAIRLLVTAARSAAEPAGSASARLPSVSMHPPNHGTGSGLGQCNTPSTHAIAQPKVENGVVDAGLRSIHHCTLPTRAD